MDIVSDVLDMLKFDSTIYFKTAFYEPWGILVPAFQNVARFHFVHKGCCWVSVGEKRKLLSQGDLVVIPRGVEHSICAPVNAKIKPLEEATADYSGKGIFSYGAVVADDVDTQLVCGHWSFDRHVSHPLIETLPDCIFITKSESASSWLEHSLALIGHETELERPGYQQVTKRLSETLFTYIVRDYLTAQSNPGHFFLALRDKNISRVLLALHQEPAKNWNLHIMSSIAALSRTGFINRFSRLVGMTPLQYLTYWRMQISCRQLLDSDLPIINVAENVGYQSEASFSRVFKKHFEMGPSEYRRYHQTTLPKH